MSNTLMDTLEDKVSSIVSTMESLRSEIAQLKEERTSLESKLRDLIARMEQVSETPAEPFAAPNSDSGYTLGVFSHFKND